MSLDSEQYDTAMSIRLATFGCETFFKSLISLNDVIGKPSCSDFVNIFFNATVFPVVICLALITSLQKNEGIIVFFPLTYPNVPTPTLCPNSKWSNWEHPINFFFLFGTK